MILLRASETNDASVFNHNYLPLSTVMRRIFELLAFIINVWPEFQSLVKCIEDTASGKLCPLLLLLTFQSILNWLGTCKAAPARQGKQGLTGRQDGNSV